MQNYFQLIPIIFFCIELQQSSFALLDIAHPARAYIVTSTETTYRVAEKHPLTLQSTTI